VARHCETNPSSAYAYFFFDGRDGQKNLQQVDSLIRSLIEQFAAPYEGIPATLAKLYKSCHNGRSQPSVESLQSALFTILEPFDDYVDIKQNLITRDIKRYIDCILDGEDAFDRWNDEIKAKIKSKLLESAGGMFVLL
jgi:hypothetical protein